MNKWEAEESRRDRLATTAAYLAVGLLSLFLRVLIPLGALVFGLDFLANANGRLPWLHQLALPFEVLMVLGIASYAVLGWLYCVDKSRHLLRDGYLLRARGRNTTGTVVQRSPAAGLRKPLLQNWFPTQWDVAFTDHRGARRVVEYSTRSPQVEPGLTVRVRYDATRPLNTWVRRLEAGVTPWAARYMLALAICIFCLSPLLIAPILIALLTISPYPISTPAIYLLLIIPFLISPLLASYVVAHFLRRPWARPDPDPT